MPNSVPDQHAVAGKHADGGRGNGDHLAWLNIGLGHCRFPFMME
jgi:hypothetical protein